MRLGEGEEFFSLQDNENMMDVVHEDEEDEENEYHEDENAVEARFNKYSIKNKFSVTDDGIR